MKGKSGRASIEIEKRHGFDVSCSPQTAGSSLARVIVKMRALALK